MFNPLNHFYTLRSYVEAYAGLLGRRFLPLIWIAAVGIVIWFYGELLGFGTFKPFEPAWNRIIAIGLLILGWLAWFVWSTLKSRKAEREMIDDLSADGRPSPDAEARAEVDVLRERLKEAMLLLRRVAKRRFGHAYELPWYLIIGAPGSGKTTSLTQSGLKFPLGEAVGAESVKGVGGTRNCNWWFAEEAILIDTAGRYTTHGDFSGADKAGWNGFLELLRKHRPSQPINGALITLSIPDLLERESEARLDDVRSIRKRLSEMDDVLRSRVPVYVVLTKADLLEGFEPFFDGLSRGERDQVWGTTFPFKLSQSPSELPDRFLSEFDLLRERVDGLLLERLQQEPDIEARGRIFQLPAKMTQLRQPVHEVLTELCSQSRFIAPPLLRGVYFASGTQETEARLPGRSLRRSYFLSRLFSGVIFKEAALVARDARLTGRTLMIRRIALGSVAAVGALILFGWIGAYVHGLSAISHAEAQTNRYAQLAKDIPTRDVNDADFLRVLPALDALADATRVFKDPPLMRASFGLSQEEKVAGSHRLAYGRALNALLLPRLMVHLQNSLKDENTTVDDSFDALKLYGMLGGLGSMDSAAAVAGSRKIFEALYPGEGRRLVREHLTAHVAALVERPLAPLAIDAELVASARKRIDGQNEAVRAFHLLNTHPRAAALSSWSVTSVVGGSGEVAFQRRSGSGLREGIAGLYTRDGFLTVVVPEIAGIARTAASEGWVRGRGSAEAQPPSDIARDALRLYFSTFEQRWRDYLADVSVRQAETIPAMAETTRILASPPFPIVQLARAVSEATDLAGALSTGPQATIAAMLPIAPGSVPDPYRSLRAALSQKPAVGDAGSRIEAIQPALRALYEQLSRASASSAEVAALFDVKGQLALANQALVGEARQLPPPIDQWLAGLAASVDALAVNSARASLRQRWAAEGGELCKAAIERRYPFDRTATREVAMDDFVRVFGPKGIFESFFTEKLAPFVDTSAQPWRWKGSFGTEGRASEALGQFALARQIRQAFFASGDQPSISITIKPESLDQSANAVILDIHGERVVYYHGPILTKTIRWPSRDGESQSRLIFQPGGWEKALTRSGPWSPLRLFDVAQKTALSPDRFRARFNHDGRSATFDVQIGSILNPFSTEVLNAFSCPESL